MRVAKSMLSVLEGACSYCNRRQSEICGAVVRGGIYITFLAAASSAFAMQPPSNPAAREEQGTTGAGVADYLPWNRATIEKLREAASELEALDAETKRNLAVLAPRCDALFVRGPYTSDPLARVWNVLRGTNIDSQIAEIRQRTGDAPAPANAAGQRANEASVDPSTMLEWAHRHIVNCNEITKPLVEILARELQQQPAFNRRECEALADQVEITGDGAGPYGWVLSKEQKLKKFCDGHEQLRQNLARHDYAFSLIWIKARETWSFGLLYDAARSFDFWYAMATNTERYGKSIYFRPLDKNAFPKAAPHTQELWKEFRSFVQGEYFWVPASSKQYADVGIPDPRDDMAHLMRKLSGNGQPLSPLYENPGLGRPSSPGFADPVDSVLLQPNLTGRPGPIAMETLQEIANPRGNVFINRALPPIEFATRWLGYYFLTNEEAASFGAQNAASPPASQPAANAFPHVEPTTPHGEPVTPHPVGNQAEAIAITKAWLQVIIDNGSEVIGLCDQADRAVTQWEEQIELLLTNADGKYIAANIDSVRVFRATYNDPRPSRKEVHSIRVSTEAIMATAKEALADDSKLYRPSDEAGELLNRQAVQLKEMIRVYSANQGTILAVLSSAKSGSAAASITLQQAIEALNAKEASERAQSIADAKEAARIEAVGQVAEAEAAKVKQEAESEAARIHVETEARRVETENSAQQARDDNAHDLRLARAKSTAVQSRLQPFFASGYWQPGDKKGRGMESKPMSLAAIRKFGALEYTEAGLQKLLSLGCGKGPQGGKNGNDRAEVWGYPTNWKKLTPRQLEELKAAQKDLVEVGEELAEIGKLSP